ncbi:uncharacterized protein ASPGLDRAFT_36683 [Aspergillus glaucus CBS 516.65]|uniref:Uncharacterized protein n=1 Tax=Aspergillus glaucus CBS 516.65 TaxID=1160497 RepID=A0A1L9VH43_ASPGL|nr:hypothetical protein ASPGLDRAFT_36683 [Aspergillus glaucus CBS 516.65]OJJ83239.1 hypothetical protein ASPGLDRAFT_36683 [Aspergillus glaucus CBS 516.65]
MFQAVGSLDLECINKQQPLQRYESEEEDISESEVGGQDHSFSPVDFHRSDSDLSADGMSNVDEPDNFPRLVSLCQPIDKDSRPVSMTTIKRASDATFVADSYIYDAEDDMIIELPSPETPSQLPSSAFLQPTVYNPLESQRSSTCLSFRSPSPASCLSDDDTDVLVAEQVKYVEPVTKPNLIMISPSSTQSDSTDETPSAGSGNLCPSSTSSSIQKEKTDMVSSPRQPTASNCTASNKRNALYDHSGDVQHAQKPNHSEPIYQGASLERMNTSAAVNCLPVPTLPHPASRPQSISTPRPRTSISDKVANHVRLPSKSLRRPPSLRSMSSFSAPFWQRPFSPRFEDTHSRSMSYSHSVYNSDATSSRSRPYSGTPSHASYSAFSRLRSESTYNLSNAACDTPLPIRNQTVKHSAAPSIWSTNSFRSDGTSENSLDASEPTDNSFKRKLGRTKTFRRTKQQQTESAEKPSGKSFLGLRLGGKRKSTVKDAHF